MQRRTIRFFPVAVAIALTAGMTTEGAAQDTTRSQTPVTSTRRIPVQKEGTTVTESPGAISRDSAARADSIAAAERARQDSIAAVERARQDSIAAAERARQEELARIERARQDSIARVEQARRDSIAAAEAAAAAAAERFRVGRFNGWYFNLGGGLSMPTGALDDLYGNGWNATGSVGWHPTTSPIGVRFDVTYDRLNGQSFPAGSANELADAAVLAGLGEVTLRIPRALGLNPYLVGGGGVYRFNDYGVEDAEASTEFGWNIGGGLRFGWGFTSLFIESRYMSVGTPGERATYIPIILGITFR